MARRLGQTPYGVAVQQDDGTVVTLPESLAPAPDPIAPPDLGAPGESPVPDIAAQDLPSPSESPVPAIASPDLMGAPPVVAPSAPVSLAPTPVELAPPLPVPDAVTGAAPLDLPPAPMVDTPQPIEPAPYTPEDQAIDAVRTQAVQAANIAQEQADALHWQQRDLAELEAKRKEADDRAAEHRASLEAAAAKAADDFASFDVTPEEKTSVASTIALIFGGIGNILMGNFAGANPVIGILERKADVAARDRAAQQAKLGQVANMRRSAVDNATAWAKDSEAQYAATRAGILESYAREIEARAADFAAPAEIAKGEQAAAQIRAAAEKARAAAVAAEQKRLLDEAKFGLDQQKVEIDRYGAQTARKNVGLGYARIGEDRRQFNVGRDDALKEKDRQYDLDLAKLDVEIDKAAKTGNSSALAAARDAREVIKDQRERTAGVFPVTEKDDKGNPIGIKWDQLKQANGAPFLASDQKGAQELRAKNAAVTQSVALIDKLTRARDKHGWSSDLYKSDEWREMQANYGQLILVAKDAAGLGALAGPDIEILNKAFGTKDPTELRDPGAGLGAARRNMLASYNAALRANGYDGEAFDIPDVSSSDSLKKAASLSDAGQIAKDVIKQSRNVKAADQVTAAFGDQSDRGIDQSDLKYYYTPDVERNVTPLFERAKTGDSTALAALAGLARDRKLGAPTRVKIIDAGIDLGPYWTPEDKAAFTRDFEAAPRNITGQIVPNPYGATRTYGDALQPPTGAAP